MLRICTVSLFIGSFRLISSEVNSIVFGHLDYTYYRPSAMKGSMVRAACCRVFKNNFNTYTHLETPLQPYYGCSHSHYNNPCMYFLKTYLLTCLCRNQILPHSYLSSFTALLPCNSPQILISRLKDRDSLCAHQQNTHK